VISSLDLLNVYQAGAIRTVFVGMSRAVTVVVFAIGLTTVAPRMYMDPDTSMWWVPAVIIGSGIPLVAFSLLSAPFVSTVRVLLPKAARKDHASLTRFAENVPEDTKVLFQTMRWAPWATHKQVFFSDLRRLPGKNLSANLEHVPLGHGKETQGASKVLGGKLAVRMYGKYWVDMTSRNKSQAPGVWEKMWDQITIKGQEALKIPPRERLPPGMTNRPAPTVSPSVGGGGGKKVLSPLPPPVRSKGGAKARSKRSR
jgi:hypothetical protein